MVFDFKGRHARSYPEIFLNGRGVDFLVWIEKTLANEEKFPRKGEV